MPSSSSPQNHHHNARYVSQGRRHGGYHPMVRWSALCTGSLLGMAAWAMAYVLGAAVACALGFDGASPSYGARVALGLYGALSASVALAGAAYTAARTGGTKTCEQAYFYGLCLWSMSSITLVVVASLASQGLFTVDMLQRTPLLAVGLAAIDQLPGSQGGFVSSPGILMLITLLTSLGMALRGACLAVDGTTRFQS